jgi:hypothetical protein
MPFKSKAQRRKFAELLVEGKISDETFEEWNRETGGAKLPERVGHKKQARPKKAAARRKPRTKTRAAARRKPRRKRKA